MNEIIKKFGEQLAPLLFNIKPSVLLSIKDESLPCGRSWHKALCCKGCNVLEDIGVTCHILKQSDKGSQILFYKHDLLHDALFEDQHFNFLLERGYMDCRSVADYLDLLHKKFMSDEFPHEIGIFLGYPFKDVIGFVTLGAQGCSAQGLWRVFGHTEKSLKYMEQIRKTKRHVAKLLEQNIDLTEYFANLEAGLKQTAS